MSGWAVETLLSSTLLMLLVLAARKPVRRLVGARVAYALWAIPAVRLAMPALPEGWRGAMMPELPAATDGVLMIGDPVLALPAHPEAGLGWPVILLAIWAAGAVALFGWHAIGYWHFCRRMRRGTRRRHMVADGRIAVIETSAAPGPLAFGILSPTIALPRDFAERYDATERNLAMAHELGHHLRGDLFANWVAILVLAFHWFNPVAWRAFRAFRTDQEMACDETVLASRGGALRHAYARAIVKSANGSALSVACHMHTVDDLKGRLRMLGRKGTSARQRLGGGAGLLALGLAGLALTASGTRAAERMRVEVENATGVEFASLDEAVVTALDMPAPPPPPAPPVPPAGPGAAPTAPTPPTPPEAPRYGQTRGEHVIVSRDGVKVVLHEGKARVFESGVEVPTITKTDCGLSPGAPVVERGWDGDRRTMTVCTDRMELISEQARERAFAAEERGRAAEERGRAAERAGREAERNAERAAAQAERAAALAERNAERAADLAERNAERAAARAERAAERGRLMAMTNVHADVRVAAAAIRARSNAAAREGLLEARRTIAASDMPEDARRRTLSDLDRQIARLSH